MKHARIALLAVLALGAQAGAWAKDTLEVTNRAFQEIEVKDKNGKVSLKTVPVSKVVPGTEVIYVMTIKNIGDQPASSVVVNNPLPKEMVYKLDSAFGANSKAEVSVDGGKNYGALAKLSVNDEQGKPRPAQSADVTHVRWALGYSIQPGQEGTVSYRALLK